MLNKITHNHNKPENTVIQISNNEFLDELVPAISRTSYHHDEYADVKIEVSGTTDD